MKTTIDVFYFPLGNEILNQQLADEAVRFLDSHEQARLRLFKKQDARARFLIARYIAKTELGRRLECGPGEVCFNYSPNGKPLLNKAGKKIWFSLSHCPDAVVYAVADSDIGVDVENISRCEKLVKKADSFFSPGIVKQIAEAKLFSPVTAFTVFWTCLEAQVKVKDSSIFSERRIFEPVPDIDGRYSNNQNINLLSLVTHTRDVVSLASRSHFDTCFWYPSATEEKAFQLMWQPGEKNAVKQLVYANGFTEMGDIS